MTTSITLTPDQEKARDEIVEFLGNGGIGPLKMGGFAGTGKTTVVSESVRVFRENGRTYSPNLAFCAFTGKAASVLKAKLTAFGSLRPGDFIGTIHSLIYRPIVNRNGRIKGFEKKGGTEVGKYDAIIVDEASMVNEQIFRDLESYGIPILAVGDHGQLPPVGFSFNLMEQPDIRLEKIHRQAEDNPIVKLSMMARETGKIPTGEYGDGVRRVTDRRVMDSLNLTDWLILCGKNETRLRLNNIVRKALGRSGPPEPGDRVICLKNNRREGVYNGMMGTLAKVLPWDEDEPLSTGADGQRNYFPFPDWLYDVEISFDGLDDLWAGGIFRPQFGQRKTITHWPRLTPGDFRGLNLFDFGYAITVHKAQGSEAENVLAFEERFASMTDDDWRRWLYTCVTRAKRRLILVGF